jgi:hypothetical protein
VLGFALGDKLAVGPCVGASVGRRVGKMLRLGAEVGASRSLGVGLVDVALLVLGFVLGGKLAAGASVGARLVSIVKFGVGPGVESTGNGVGLLL